MAEVQTEPEPELEPAPAGAAGASAAGGAEAGWESGGGFDMRQAGMAPRPMYIDRSGPGDAVVVHGLVGAAQHNGRVGRVVKFDAAKGRYVVRLAGPTEDVLAVKPANLRLREAGDSPGAAGAGGAGASPGGEDLRPATSAEIASVLGQFKVRRRQQKAKLTRSRRITKPRCGRLPARARPAR